MLLRVENNVHWHVIPRISNPMQIEETRGKPDFHQLSS